VHLLPDRQVSSFSAQLVLKQGEKRNCAATALMAQKVVCLASGGLFIKK